jgi:hypothetical protein
VNGTQHSASPKHSTVVHPNHPNRFASSSVPVCIIIFSCRSYCQYNDMTISFKQPTRTTWLHCSRTSSGLASGDPSPSPEHDTDSIAPYLIYKVIARSHARYYKADHVSGFPRISAKTGSCTASSAGLVELCSVEGFRGVSGINVPISMSSGITVGFVAHVCRER